MSDAETIAFYRATLVATARTLPLADAVVFLRGALFVADDHHEMTEVRSAYVNLQQADAQLELIAGPQSTLNLGGAQG